ncbi:MAG: SpoIIE family protein phosphatase [Pseudomonadota bacterium]
MVEPASCLQDKLEIFLKASLFSFLPPHSRGILVLCQAAQWVEYESGEILFREGDYGDSLYLIVNGALRIIKDEVPVWVERTPGTCVGEMALVSGEPRSATVQAMEKTRLLRITRDDFNDALGKDVRIARGVFSAMNRKLQDNLLDQVRVERREIARREALRLAIEVQRSLLPDHEIQHPQLETAGYNMPADSVGGDYYDYLRLSDGCLGFFEADVMDHGLHSAILMAMLKSGLHTQIVYDDSVDAVLKAVSRIVDEQIGVLIFLTCCYVRICPDRQELEYVNAGNPPLLLYRMSTEEILELASRFPPPGLLPKDARDTGFEGRTMFWQPGDLLVIYSDGLVEARNTAEEMYGLAKLKDILKRLARLSAVEILRAVLDDFNAFTQHRPLKDDLTLVIAKARHGVPEEGESASSPQDGKD